MFKGITSYTVRITSSRLLRTSCLVTTRARASVLVDGKGRSVNSLVWWSKLPKGVSVVSDPRGFYSVDVTDVPPIPNEDWMPPIQSYLYRVFFYYNYTSNAGDFWVSEGKDWSKDEDKFADQSKTIREAVTGLVSPTDNAEAKAKKLYAAVEALDNTDYSRKKSESELKQLKMKAAKHAEDTWKQKSGDSEEIAMLYLAMARSAGLTAYAFKVVSRSRGVFDPSYMDIGQLDDTLILLDLDGKPMLVDPGEKMCPFGTVNWRHSDAGGVRQSKEGPGYSITPPQTYAENTTKRTGSIEVDVHGKISGNIRIMTAGQESLKWRQRALAVDADQLKKEYDKSLQEIIPDGVEGHLDHFLGLDSPDSILMAVINVKGTLGTSTSKRLLLPSTFFESRQHAPFVSQEKRLEPVDMHYAELVDDEISFNLPDGVSVEGAPQDTQIPWKGHAVYVLKTATKPGQVTIIRQLVRAFDMVKPEEYQDLRGFYQKVGTADQQSLVLAVSDTPAPAAAAKGN